MELGMNDSTNHQQDGRIPLDLSSNCAVVNFKNNNARPKTPRQNDLLRVIQSVREVISCCACFSSDASMKECANGHLICYSCFLTIRQDDRPQCPTCRAALFPDSKRALTAQKVLSELPDICLQCNQGMLNKELTGHRLNSCSKRRVSCGLSPLGCSWCGAAENYAEHYDECDIRKNFQERPVEVNLSNVLARFRRRDQMLRETFTCFAALFRHLEGFELQTVLIPLSACKTDANSVTFRSDQFYGGQSRWVINLTVNLGEESQDDANLDAVSQISDAAMASEIQPTVEIRESIGLNTSSHNSSESASNSPQYRGNDSSYRQRRQARFQGNLRSRPYPSIRRERSGTNNNNNNADPMQINDKIEQGGVRQFGELSFTITKENSPGVGRKNYAFIPLQIESSETGAQVNFRPLIFAHRFLSRGERTPEFSILPMRWRHLSSLRELLRCGLLNLEMVIGRKLADEQAEQV